MSELRWPVAACSVVAFVVVGVGSCSKDETTGPSSSAANVSAGPGASSSQSGTGASGGTPSSGGNGMGGSSSSASAGGGNAGGSSGSAYDCSPAAGSPGSLKLTSIVGNLSSPVLVKSEPEAASRLYVVQQPGIVTLVINGTPSTFLDIQNLVDFGGEQGLLGLAFHPNYASNGRFFVHYTDNASDTAVAEYARDPNNFNVALPTGTVFYTINDFASNHNGGSIEFGGDGMLYIFMGDGGGGGDPNETGQNINTRLGKILRLNIDPTAYTPAGAVPNGLPEIWDYGLRNPWRASFDACTGDLYFGDVGQNAWEEIDVEPAGTGNRNYGWDCREGMHNYETSGCPSLASMTEPVLEYSHSVGCSVTGGYVYRGSAIPWLRGSYFYGDYCSGDIWTTTVNPANNTATSPVSRTNDLNSGNLNISSFGQDAAGEVYVVHHGGTVYRIDPE